MASIFDLQQYVLDYVTQTQASVAIPGFPWILDTGDDPGYQVDLIDQAYDTINPVMTLEDAGTYPYTNGTAVQQSLSTGLGASTTATGQFTVTYGVTNGTNSTFSIGMPPYGGASVNLTFSETFSKANSQSLQTTQTWNYQVNVAIPAFSKVVITLQISKASYGVPFKAKIQITGRFYFNSGHVDAQHGGNVASYSCPVSEPFNHSPNPNVTVVDENTIVCSVSGVCVGVQGTQVSAVASQYTLAGVLVTQTPLPPQQ